LASNSEPARDRHASRRALVKARQIRAAALVLVLIAAALYVAPLRAFFAAQDSYFSQRAALMEVQAANRALHRQFAEMHSEAYVVRQARQEWQLVPAGLQAFAVKGLPQSAPSPAPSGSVASAPLRITLGVRLSDLWRTLRQ
jgi:cell division protein FtsB